MNEYLKAVNEANIAAAQCWLEIMSAMVPAATMFSMIQVSTMTHPAESTKEEKAAHKAKMKKSCCAD